MERKFLKMDLHIHSSCSFDCRTPPRDIVREARIKGLDVIGITDHGTRAGALEAGKAAEGIRVVVGQEVKTREGDLLVYNVGEDLEEGQGIARTCRKARKLGGFVIVPHPFDPLRQGAGKHLEKIVKYIHAIEGFNPKCFFGWSNRKAEEFARKAGIPAVAGSDAHSAGEIGRSCTIAWGEDPFKAIRDFNIKMEKGGASRKMLFRKGVEKVLRRL
jgi:hypothetical protein